MKLLGILLGGLVALGSGCWTHTPMDLPVQAAVARPAAGAGKRVLVAIHPRLSMEPSDNEYTRAMGACLKPGGSFEKMLCGAFVEQMRKAGFAGEARCLIGAPPPGWQGSHDYLYEQELRVSMKYRSKTTLIIYFASLMSVFHKPFDVEISSRGTLTTAGGEVVEVTQKQNHEFMVGCFGIPGLVWNQYKVENEVLLCAAPGGE